MKKCKYLSLSLYLPPLTNQLLFFLSHFLQLIYLLCFFLSSFFFGSLCYCFVIIITNQWDFKVENQFCVRKSACHMDHQIIIINYSINLIQMIIISLNFIKELCFKLLRKLLKGWVDSISLRLR